MDRHQALKAEFKRGAISQPTMCLGCHILVEMIAGDVAWHCPRCGRFYDYRHWKIKLQRKRAAEFSSVSASPSADRELDDES